MNKQELIDFENEVVRIFNDGQLRSPVHLSGGDESEIIEIFEKVKPNDWVFSTYRSHYHALLKGIDKDWLLNWIKDNKSIHVMNKEHKFFTSAIVGGTLPIALGVAMSIKNSQRKKDEDSLSGNHLESRSNSGEENKRGSMPVDVDNHVDDHVWCFIGDMTGHTGVFWECLKYAKFHKLPITFVIADNGLSTDTPTGEVWGIGNDTYYRMLSSYFDNIIYYRYIRTWPHYGTGKFISKIWDEVEKDDVKEKGF